MNKEQYLKFIANLSKKYHKIFGLMWWNSLLHEKNVSKSCFWEDIQNNRIPNNSFFIFEVIYKAIRKYFVFVYRYFNSYKTNNDYKKIGITYFDQKHLSHIQNIHCIYIPQRRDYKKIKMYKQPMIDQFLTFWDIVKMPFVYLYLFYRYSFYILFYLSEDIENERKNLYKILKRDIWRSFTGDVLIEGLFHECIFKNMKRNLRKDNYIPEIYYPYEGLGWEKILCKYNPNTYACQCSLPIDNFLYYWYNEDEVEIMAYQGVLPYYFEVLGNNSFIKFKKQFSGVASTFVIKGDKNRFSNIEYLSKRSNLNNPYISVVLGGVEDENKELMEWVKKHYYGNKNVRIKKHPDNIFEYNQDFEYALGDLNLLLTMSRLVIVKRSSVAVVAAICGCEVIVPKLEKYNIDYCPLEEKYRNRKLNIQERKQLYLENFGE